MTDLRELKDKATTSFAKGKFSKAAEYFEAYCKGDPRDLHARLRMGDAWVKAGKKDKAIDAYQFAAEGFAKDGFLPRAIAAGKLILELEPTHVGVQQMLADLYAQRTGTVVPRPERPSTPSRAPIQAAVERTSRPAPVPLESIEVALGDFSASEAKPSAGPSTSASVPEIELTIDIEVESNDQSLLQACEAAALAGLERRGTEPVEQAPSQPSAARLFAPIPLFGDLPRDAFIALVEQGPLRRPRDGETIIEQGSLGNAFYVVCAGAVQVFRDEGGRRRQLATLGEGAFFGEMAFLSGTPRSATVKAKGDETQLLELAAPLLTQLSARYPSIAQALKKFCRQRLLANVMATAPLFQPFGREDRRALVQKFRAREVRKGEVVVREGDRSDGMYVVLSGEVEVAKAGARLARLREGDLFGEMSLLKKSPATATVVAMRRTSLLRLPREDFDSLIVTHPQVLELLSALTDERSQRLQTVQTDESQSESDRPLMV